MSENSTVDEPGVRVALAQISARQAWADPNAVESNVLNVRDLFVEYADDVDLMVFPEVALTGYIPLKGYDQRRKRTLAEAAKQAAGWGIDQLREASRNRRAVLIVGTMEPALMRHEFHNSVVVIDDGEVLGVYRKIHLPVEENHYFVPGDEVVVVDTRAGRIAPMICYDLLFPEVTRIAALKGAEIVVMVSNWLDIAHLRRLGEVLPVARALESHAHVLFVNGVGELEARGRKWELYGSSRAVTATGEVAAVAGSDQEILIASMPASHLDAASDVFPVMRDRRPDLYRALIAPASSFAALGRGIGVD